MVEPGAERKLWLGVILRATQEAESSYIYGGDEVAIKNAARRWLMVRSRDLLEVCRMAGLDEEHTERLIQESRKKYATPISRRRMRPRAKV